MFHKLDNRCICYYNKIIMDKSKLAAQSKKYQAVSDISLPLHGHNILMLDGNAFHTFTRGMERPFDDYFIKSMNEVAVHLMENIPSARFGFVQSDEISIYLHTPEEQDKEASAFFSNRVQKIVSLAAARASVKMTSFFPDKNPALFDARFFNVPSAKEAAEHFLWRQRDCTKNSIQSVGQAFFSHKELHGKNSLDIREMLQEKGNAWENYANEYKYGRVIRQVERNRIVEYVHKKTLETNRVNVTSKVWEAEPAERFEESGILYEYFV